MISMFLDTSSYNIIVGIYKNKEELILNIEKNDNHLSERIMIIIDETLKKINLNIKDVDNIFVVTGPGSFTGTRIGVTVAKVLAWTLNKRIVPISELDVLTSGSKGKTAALIDARRNYVYAGVYNDGENIIEDKYIYLDDFISKIDSKVNIVSYDNIDLENIKLPQIDIKKIISNHLKDESINPHALNPNYLKLTEAEEKLNDKTDK